MEDREQIQQECLLAALQYFDPALMELQLDQEEQASYTHKFFVMTKDAGAIIYRISAVSRSQSRQLLPYLTCMQALLWRQKPQVKRDRVTIPQLRYGLSSIKRNSRSLLLSS